MQPVDLRSADGKLGLDDFYAISLNRFLCVKTQELWSADRIDHVFPPMPTGQKRNGKQFMLKPSIWLERFRRVDQLSWAPGEPKIIGDRLIFEGGWQAEPGASVLNLYRPPTIVPGDPAQATRWVDLVRLVFPDNVEHLLDCLAFRVQHPGEKINHALVLGGAPGIGKDTILKPVRDAIGVWNFKDITPDVLIEPFSPWVKAAILRINEAHDLGDSARFNRFAFNEKLKIYAAAPPEVLRCHEKHLPASYVPNVLLLIITTNHKTDGVYLTSDDRRYYIAWSPRTPGEFAAGYFLDFQRWLTRECGARHVTAYLRQRDLPAFDPAAPPKRTEAFYAIVQAGRAPEDVDLDHALDELGRPAVVSVATIATTPTGATMEWLFDRKYRAAAIHRMDRCGYTPCRNPNSKRGSWTINERKWTLYADAQLNPAAQLQAAADFILKAAKASGSS